MGVIFDKLFFVKRLADAGTFTRPQAEAPSEAFQQAVAESVATKQDIALFRSETKAGLAELRSEMKIGFAELRSGNAETRVWSVSVGATILAMLAAIKYFG